MITKLANDVNEEINSPGVTKHLKAATGMGKDIGAGVGGLAGGLTGLRAAYGRKFDKASVGRAGLGLLGAGIGSTVGGGIGGAIGGTVGAVSSPTTAVANKVNRVVGGDSSGAMQTQEDVNAERLRSATLGGAIVGGASGGIVGAGIGSLQGGGKKMIGKGLAGAAIGAGTNALLSNEYEGRLR